MKQARHSWLIAGIGAALLAAGLVLLKLDSHPQGVMLALPYVCIGLGCGAFGYGLGDLIQGRAVRKHPQLQKQMEIEQKDERNIAISNRAKAKAYDVMLYVFGALMVALALMSVSLTAILLLVAAYLIVVGCFIFFLNRYHQEM